MVSFCIGSKQNVRNVFQGITTDETLNGKHYRYIERNKSFVVTLQNPLQIWQNILSIWKTLQTLVWIW